MPVPDPRPPQLLLAAMAAVLTACSPGDTGEARHELNLRTIELIEAKESLVLSQIEEVLAIHDASSSYSVVTIPGGYPNAGSPTLIPLTEVDELGGSRLSFPANHEALARALQGVLTANGIEGGIAFADLGGQGLDLPTISPERGIEALVGDTRGEICSQSTTMASWYCRHWDCSKPGCPCVKCEKST